MRLASLALLVLAVAACPRKPPDPVPVDPEEGIAQRPTLASTFASLDLSLYEGFIAGPADGTALGVLARHHDADRYTATLQRWGPPTVPVVQLEDTDSPTRVAGALAGWKLADGPEDLAEPKFLPPGALTDTDVSALTVSSVLQRSWEGGPSAADPFDLLLGLAEHLPAPWSVCRPRTEADVQAEEADGADPGSMSSVVDPVVLYAIDGARGTRLGLRALAPDRAAEPVSGQGPFEWEIDHIEQVPAARRVESLWTAMGYMDCPELGRVLDAERARRPKRSLGPKD